MKTIERPNLSNSEIILPSPFHCDSSHHIITENKNRNCTHAEIDLLSSKGLLNTIDFAILKLLAKYRYLNAYNITIALKQELHEGYQKDDYKRNLRKLVKAGILIRHAIGHSVSEEETEQSFVIASSLRFYELSHGAYTYIAPSIPDSYKQKRIMSNLQVFNSLAVSQFLIHFNADYQFCIKSIRRDIVLNAGEETLNIPAEIHTFASEILPALRICLLCARDNAESRKTLLTSLPLLSHYLNSNPEQDYKTLILLLVENMCDIPDIHHRILTMHNTLPPNLFYITDTSILTAPIFQNLYICDETNLQYRIKHYSLTQKNGTPT